MAYPFEQVSGLTKEQAETLRELNSFAQISDSAAWKKVLACLDETVETAKKELLGYELGSVEQVGILALCWRERELVRRGLVQFVENHVSERQKLLEELKEQDGNNSDSTRSNDQ